MAFQLQNWNPQGVSLGYRPQTVQFANNKLVKPNQNPMVPGVPGALGTPGPAIAPGAPVTTGPDMPPKSILDTLGMFVPPRPGEVVKPLAPLPQNANIVQGIDSLFKATGALLSQPGALAPGVDPAAYAALAKGKGAGTGETKKFNESALASILTLGTGNLATGNGKGKGKDGGKPSGGGLTGLANVYGSAKNNGNKGNNNKGKGKGNIDGGKNKIKGKSGGKKK